MLILKQTLALIMIWNNSIYTCACVSVCIYFIIHYIYYFLFSWLLVLVSITSSSFDVKSDGFCLLKIWIYELKGSTMKTTLWDFRELSIFRGKFYCLCLVTVAVDINVKTLKENGILLSQFDQNVVEACFLRNKTGWDYLPGYRFKIKFHEIWLYFYI